MQLVRLNKQYLSESTEKNLQDEYYLRSFIAYVIQDKNET